jgi:Electron transfer DM13
MSTLASSGWRRRRWAILAASGLVVIVAAIVLALFQPWKLWVDDKVDEATPVGAVPITAPAATEPPAAEPSTSTTKLPPTSTAPATAPTAAPATTATSAPTTVAPTPLGGEFTSIDHGTSGSVVVLQDPTGRQFVRVENLETTNGPDLFVYLSTNPPDGPEDQFDDDYISLGRLAGNLGSSNYEVPADTDLSRFASVVIWCDRFNSAFGAAGLR